MQSITRKKLQLFTSACLTVLLVVSGVFVSQTGFGQTTTTRFNDGCLTVFKVTSSSALGNTGTAVITEEYLPAGTAQSAPNYSVSIPAGSSGVVISGSATSSGAMTRSENGRYLILPGYAANVGDANSTFTTNGTARTLNAAGSLGAGVTGSFYSTANDLRGATSDDGSNFWFSGGSLGIRYTNNGTSVTTVTTTSTNTRVVNIFNGQLFYSTGSGTNGIYKVGNGKPVTTGQTSTLQAPATAPYSFSVSPDGLTIYSFGSANIIVRFTYSGTYDPSTFTYSGGTWSAASTGFTLSGATGVAVDWTGYSFTTGANGAKIFACNPTTLVTGNDNGTGTITTTTLRTISGNNAFRGLAFSPTKQTVSKGSNTPVSGNIIKGNNNVVLFQFNVSADEGNSSLKKVIINNTGTAAASDISNYRLIIDANNDGIADAGEISASLATGSISGSNISFSFSTFGYTVQGSNKNLLVIGDVSVSAASGRTFIPAILTTNTINTVAYTSNLTNAGGSLVTVATGVNAPGGNTLTITAAVAPSLAATPGTLSGFMYVQGSGPSPSQSFSLSGTNLTGAPGSITVDNTSATNFEVSSDNSSFGASITVPYSSATLSGTNVYVRLKAGFTATNYSGTLSISGGGATQSVTVSGTVTPPPTLTPSTNNVTVSSYTEGAGPAAGTLMTVSGSDLSGFPGNITVTGSTDYEVSTTSASAGFGAAATIPFTSATLTSSNIWIRLKAGLSQGSYNGESVTISGGNATPVNITVNGSVAAPSPILTPSPASLTGFSYTLGSGPSASQSFALSGANLTGFPGNITVTGSADYEVSSDNATFGGTALVPFTSGALSSANVYVRLKAGLAVNSYNNETISISGGGASGSITTSGDVLPVPVINPPGVPLLTGFFTNAGTASTAQSFTISGNNLQANIVITPGNTAYEVSSTSATSGFAATVSLTPSTGTVATTTIYTRLAAAATAGTQNGTINITSTNAASQSVSVSGTVVPPAALAEVIFPQFIEGNQPTNNNRVPFAYRATLSNLKPSATYRYYNAVELVGAAANATGAGNNIYPDYTVVNSGNFTYSTGPSLSTAGNYGLFTTDATGSFTGWFIIAPSGNATRFAPGTILNTRIILNNGVAGSGTTGPILISANTIKVLNMISAAGANNGTGLRGASSFTPKNFAVVYDNTAGTGRPLSASFVEDDGVAETASFPAFYTAASPNGVNGINGAFGMIVPNTNANGVRRIEQRDIATGVIVNCPSVDADGIWPSGVNTVNPAGGTTELYITAGDIATGASNTITASSGANGTVTPVNGTSVACGASQTYNIIANSSYIVDDVLVDGVSQGPVTTYTFSNVTAPHTISATFVINNLTITATAGAGGSVSPGGAVSVTGGSDQTFTITPNACNDITDVTVDGTSQGIITSYTFTNVSANHTINASFAPSTFTQWTGAVSSDWNDIANWTTCVPNAALSVYIPGNGSGTPLVTRQPVLTGDAVTGDLEMGTDATLTIAGNTLTINGLYSDDGNSSLIGSNTSNLVINGTNGINRTFLTLSSAVTLTLKNLTVNGGTTTLTTPVDITGGTAISTSGVVTIAGGAVLESNSFLTVKSNAFGTARVAAGDNSQYITGDVTVERYIPNNGFRSWRLLSVPTSGSQTIKASWQEGNAPLANNKPNFGTQIPGPGGAGAGFDAAASSGSLLSWNGTGWTTVASTLGAISADPNKSYFLFIRGERSKGIAGTNSNTSATTLRTTGQIYTGDRSSGTIPAGSFALMPNLYPSAINFTTLTRTGSVANTFYIWDSKKQNGSSLGAYQTFSGTNGFATPLSGGSYGTSNTTIESGQAFFVTTSNAGTGTVTAHESGKISSTPGSLGFRPITPAGELEKIDSRLINGNNAADANVVVFDNLYSNAVDGDDALKLTNPGENFAILRGIKTLAIEGRQVITNMDTLYFKMWNLRQQSYQLQFEPANLGTSGLTAWLEDSYLHSSTMIDLNAINNISFTIDANEASAAADRFRIILRAAAPLPVHFTSISAIRTITGVQVDWKVSGERNIRSFEIQRSADGKNFTAAGTVTSNSNSTNESGYRFNDAGAPAKTVFYRIGSKGAAGEINYTSIVKVMAGNVKPAFSISPNPVEGGIVNIQFSNQAEGRYTITLVNNAGQKVFTAIATHAGGNSTQIINLPQDIASGAYEVEIISPDKTRTAQTLLIQ